jgi:hypothetical protein
MRFLGVDPGAKGAICLLDVSSGDVQFLPTPVRKGMPSFNSVFASLWPVENINFVPAAVEDVHSLYGMSAKSNFAFGYNLGLVHALLRACGISYIEVAPKVWQKACSLPSRKELGDYPLKQAVADVAHLLYPEADIYGPKGGLMDGRADALLIAHYLWLQHEDK